MARVGFLKEDGKDFLVGAEDRPVKKDDLYPYRGPIARVSHDNTWLFINTDDYEGNAMLNIEALPYLRRALAKIEKRRKALG